MRKVWGSRRPTQIRFLPNTSCHTCEFFIYTGTGFGFFYCCFGPELSFSPLRYRFLYPHGLSYRCLRLGVNWKLNRPRPVSFTSLPGRPFLPCFVPFRICRLRLDVLGKPRLTYVQGFTTVLVCRSRFPFPPAFCTCVLRFVIRLTIFILGRGAFSLRLAF